MAYLTELSVARLLRIAADHFDMANARRHDSVAELEKTAAGRYDVVFDRHTPLSTTIDLDFNGRGILEIEPTAGN